MWLHMPELKPVRYEIPISEDLIDELFPFWASIFGEVLPDIGREVFLGAEGPTAIARSTCTERVNDWPAPALPCIRRPCRLWRDSARLPRDPRLRGRGIATELCRQAVEDFRAAGGEAFLLGTVNPAAARVYHRLGWRKLAGAAVMVNVLIGESPESFLVDYFKEGTATVVEATAAHRIAIVPLLVCPHDWQVLDANAKMYSTRYTTLKSCMGLYVRYQRIKLSAGCAWFVAKDG